MRILDTAYIATLFALSKEQYGRIEHGSNKRTVVSRFSLSASSTSDQIQEAAEIVNSGRIPPFEKKYEDLLTWLKSKDGVFIHNSLVLKPSSRGGGYGAFLVAGEDDDDNKDNKNKIPLIQTDELLFTIPRSICITLDDALNDKYCGEAFRKLIETAGPGGNTVALAGFMTNEWYQCTKENSNNNFDVTSKYGPYLATLPWERGINSQEHILYWDDDQIESILKGSMCYGEALDLRKEVNVAIKVLNTIIGRAIVEKESKDDDNTFRWPWENKVKGPIAEIPGLANIVKAAFVSVLTRAFEDDYYGTTKEDGGGSSSGSDKEKMVPLLDMLQHSDQPNVSHAMRKVDGSVEVRAKKPLYVGDELLNQYRSELEESMPYHRFFTRFGFVPGIQENILNLFEDKSSIFFAQKAEV